MEQIRTNLKTVLFNFILILLIVSCKNNDTNDQKNSLLKQSTKLNNSLYQIVKLDSLNSRYFVVIDTSITKDFAKICSIVLEIEENYLNQNINNKFFHVSFFSDVKYAKYKDELKLSILNIWPKHYLAEFNSEKGELVIYPLIPAKQKIFKLK